jgi:hypothetical protein
MAALRLRRAARIPASRSIDCLLILGFLLRSADSWFLALRREGKKQGGAGRYLVSWKVGAISRAGRLLCFRCLGLVDRMMRKAHAQDCRLPSDGSPEHVFFF